MEPEIIDLDQDPHYDEVIITQNDIWYEVIGPIMPFKSHQTIEILDETS